MLDGCPADARSGCGAAGSGGPRTASAPPASGPPRTVDGAGVSGWTSADSNSMSSRGERLSPGSCTRHRTGPVRSEPPTCQLSPHGLSILPVSPARTSRVPWPSPGTRARRPSNGTGWTRASGAALPSEPTGRNLESGPCPLGRRPRGVPRGRSQLLEPEFEVVTTVRDGRAALEEAARLDPDMLILDISMSGMDGIEAARHLRAAGSRAKIVFLTVHGDPDFVRAGLAAGATGYVVKSRLASDLLPP